MKIFTNDDIKAIDRLTIERGVSATDLIERVAEGVTDEIVARYPASRPTAIFAGPGNNGADALAVAARLAGQGFFPDIYLFNIGGDKLSEECRFYRDIVKSIPGIRLMEVTGAFTLPEVDRSFLIIDGLFGSGLREGLTGGFKTLVQFINDSGAAVVSIDVPSGMFSDWNRGAINRNIIHAQLTIAIQFPRLAFLMKENQELVGEWKTIDIGLDPDAIRHTRANFQLVDQGGIRKLIKHRRQFCSKADFGHALLVAGSYGMMGAAIFAAKGAIRSGVGKLSVHSASWGYEVLQSTVPEALFSADHNDNAITAIPMGHHYNAIAVGPGIGTSEPTIAALEHLLKSATEPLVLDADALNCIAQRRQLLDLVPDHSVITPHAGEFDRIFGSQPSDEERLLRAIKAAEDYNIIILLKGRYSALVRPDGQVYFNSSGTPALATAGSGDVLTGIILSLMAQGYKPDIAALTGAYIHGLAGHIAAERHGIYGTTASDIADCVGRAILRLSGE
ncbi:MAG: NAD(P)H-hydrate dehydratase [Pseudoflavonifractor sp.]|nr:NAD(P)H-hydrate dehydratase [Alloprevotella sp.]MCM1116382.1 NAD(P)H-hydrate dehydratase [Pseudoflavonifractor sp.]